MCRDVSVRNGTALSMDTSSRAFYFIYVPKLTLMKKFVRNTDSTRGWVAICKDELQKSKRYPLNGAARDVLVDSNCHGHILYYCHCYFKASHYFNK